MHQILVRLSVCLSVCLTPFNSETVADMENFSKATPLKSKITVGNDLRFLKLLVFNGFFGLLIFLIFASSLPSAAPLIKAHCQIPR